MLKKSLHIIFSLLLVFTTTTSIWEHLIANDDDPIEVKTEKETDSEETEKEKELDDLDDDLIHSGNNLSSSGLPIFKSFASNRTADERQSKNKLYLAYHRLKVAC